MATNTWIERSRDHPLSIVFVVSQPITSVDGGRGFWGCVSAGLRTICKVSHRWKRVRIRLSTIEPDSESLVGFMLDPLLNLNAEDVPLLESLSMNSFQSSVFSDHMGDSLLVPTTNVLRAPSLRSLRLEYISVPWRKLPVQWLGLTELKLSSVTDSYGVIDAGVELFGVAQAFALLKTCQNLVRCDLALAARSQEGEFPMKDPDGVALLPTLKDLIIRGPIPGADFLRGLRVGPPFISR
ncbi:hypothetical protein FA13DRAFT_1874325 [Coprinellus micaceus]|uniref:F-box domain-containing protein n=1 Tax=Coprinellus micaceus TaxID=71717 RepID=A0A4Y7T2T1_COPMI|nr:hypothetical protein FA13DRAFT_1874325 [Coprinellus micaceus]